MGHKGASKRQYRLIQRKIKESSLLDFIDWVDKCVGDMEAADRAGDTKKNSNW